MVLLIWHAMCIFSTQARRAAADRGGRRWRRPAPGLALLGLLLAATSGMGAGCIVPAPLFEQDDQDSPVMLDEMQLRPSPNEVLVFERSARRQVFQLGEVLDEDTDDTLHLRWFLDWKDGIMSAETLVPNGGVVRRPSPWTVDFCSSSVPNDQTLYVVQAVLADRDFLPGDDLRALPAGTSQRTVSWLVELQGVCQP